MRILFVSIVFLSMGISAFAEQLPVRNSNIGVIRMEVLMEESLLAKDIQRQLQTFRSQQQQRIAAREEQLKRQDRALMNIAESEIIENNPKIYAFRAEVEQLHRDMQQQRSALDTAYNKAMKELDLAIAKSTATVAKRQQLDLIMPAKHMIYIARTHDVTEEVLQVMNREHARYTLELKVP